MWEISDYRFAETPPDAVRMLREGPGRGVYLAGGTDLLLFPPDVDYVVDISRCGIDAIARTPDGDLFIGAAATLQNVATNPLTVEFAGGELSRVAAHCGNRPVRTTATIGGNLCNALPSADLAPILLALDTTCFITDEDSQESLPLSDFFVAPRRTVLEDRLLVGLAIPAEAAVRRCANWKLTRSAEDIALAMVAVAADVDDGVIRTVRIALGAVAPVPMRSTLAEDALEDFDMNVEKPETLRRIIADAATIAASEAEPIDDHRAGAEYRRDMVRVMTRRLLERVLDVEAAASEGGSS
jgi:carbon-monoxide dehydrogenase medium subunit